MIEHKFRGHIFKFVETKTAPVLISEIFRDNYKVFERGITFDGGDVIIDAGANEGMFSIMMSVFFPVCRIIAFEPVPMTFQTLNENIELNKCKNIETSLYGVGHPNQTSETLNVSKDFSGGSTSKCRFNPEHHYQVTVNLLDLKSIFTLWDIERCRLLKMDIEGMEYDALYYSDVLHLVDYFTAEFHTNANLDYEGRRMQGLASWVGDRTKIINLILCNMAE
jgi:FkbM family methyltransferase